MIAVLMIALVSTSVFVMASNPAPKSGTSYIKGNKLIGQIDSSDQMLMYQLDARGDVRTVIEQDGDPASPIAMQDYLPFGGISSYGIDSRHKYKTLEYEDITNLYLGGYDPEIGRFIIPVTSEAHPFDPETLTVFVKDRNNPYRIFNSQELFPGSRNFNPSAELRASLPVQAVRFALPSASMGGSESGVDFGSTSRLWYLASAAMGVNRIFNPTQVKIIIETTISVPRTTTVVLGSGNIKSWKGLSETFKGENGIGNGIAGIREALNMDNVKFQKLIDGTWTDVSPGEYGLSKYLLGDKESGLIDGIKKSFDRVMHLDEEFRFIKEAKTAVDETSKVAKKIDGGKFCGLG